MPENDLFVFTPQSTGRRASVSVDPTVRSEHPVSALLFGKFCEHLGRNIYQGMEAQILFNPTFGDLPGGDGLVEHLAERSGWPDAEALKASYADGGTLGWFRLAAAGPGPLRPAGGAEVLLSTEPGPHGARSQRFETPGAAGGARRGLGQWTRLPLHRTRGHEFHIVARATKPCRVELSLSAVDAAGAPLATARLDLTDDWRTFTGRLDIPAGAPAEPDGLYLIALTAGADANIVVDRILLYGDDHIDHADPDIIRMLTDARLSILRWPGGNFVSGFDWRDGIGPVDARPTRPNPVWRGTLESNLFGTDEFITYCRHVGCEPLICVNAGNGTADVAAAWVEYCNGSPDTPMGRLRADNGHPEPHGVRYWEIGNEIFGRHQIGWTTPAGNIDRYRRFAAAMRAADPSIRLLACGGLHLGVDHEWNRLLNHEAAADCQTHHILEGGDVDESVDPGELFGAFMAYPIRVAADYRLMRQRMLEVGIANPRLAITELQLFAAYRPKAGAGAHGHPPRGRIPAPATISEALYLTLIVHESIRLGDLVEMITHSATVNHGGGLRKARQRVWANPVHCAHVMGAALAGGTPLGVRLACGTFSTSREFGHLPVVEGAPDLDAMAVVAADGQSLYLMLVHRAARSGPIDLDVDLGGLAAAGPAEVLTLAGASLDDENTFEQPERIIPQPSAAAVKNGSLRLTLAPWSLTRVRVPLARP